LVNKRQTSK